MVVVGLLFFGHFVWLLTLCCCVVHFSFFLLQHRQCCQSIWGGFEAFDRLHQMLFAGVGDSNDVHGGLPWFQSSMHGSGSVENTQSG
jgi:hypothetical protein